MKANDLVICTENLGKSFGEVHALKSLDLRVPQKSIFAFLGPNGAGKTTTIKLLLGLIKPTRGGGKILGMDISRESVDIRARIGYLPQDARFYEHMTARQTLEYTFIAANLMVALHTFYWIALVLMMGTLSESSSGVIAVPMALFFTFWMGTGLFPPLIYISPLLLTFTPAPDQFNSLAGSFMTGEPVFSWLPLISTVVSCVIFIAVAIRRFNRQEF